MGGGGRAFHFRCNYGQRRWKNPSHFVDMFVERTTLQGRAQTVVILIEERVEDDGHCSSRYVHHKYVNFSDCLVSRYIVHSGGP